MAWWKGRTEHAGPKRGKGEWAKKSYAKRAAAKFRRTLDKQAAREND